MASNSNAINRTWGWLWHGLENFWNRHVGAIVSVLVLLIAAGLGVLAPMASDRTVVLIALGGLAAAPLAYAALHFIVQRREWAPVLILCACIFVPISVPVRGSRYVMSLVLTAVFVVLWVLRLLTVERRLALLPSPMNWPLLGFIVVTIISLAWSNLYRDVTVAIWSSFPFVQISSALVMILLPALFLMVNNYFHDLKWLKIMVAVLIAGAVFGLGNEFVVTTLPVQTRGTFTMWVVSITMALLLFMRRLNVWLRLGLGALVLGWCYWSFGLRITWLASWLPTLVALTVILFMRSKALLAMLVSAALIWAFVNWGFITDVFAAEDQESGGTRLAAWAQNWLITQDHWLFGTGPAGYAVYYMSYFPNQGMATHSNYLDILSQVGITGAAFYLAFFGLTAWSAYRLCRRLQGRGDFAEALANAALGGAAGCIVINAFGDWLIPFAYTQGISGFDYAAYNWLFLAVIPVLERLTRDSDTESKTYA
jgi:O-antigen ligase